MFARPTQSYLSLPPRWHGRLGAYRHHRNDEHLEALYSEALRFCGLHLENDLCDSSYWADSSLAHRVDVLLFLVDRGVVIRSRVHGRIVYEATPEAESWVCPQPSLAAYLTPTLELIVALRHYQSRRLRAD